MLGQRAVFRELDERLVVRCNLVIDGSAIEIQRKDPIL
jgi:hypothetical protein